MVLGIWAACGEDKTLLLQAGTVQLPVPVTKWLATSIGGLVGRHLISNMVKTAQRAAQPGNPWDKAMAEDRFGGRLKDIKRHEYAQQMAFHLFFFGSVPNACLNRVALDSNWTRV